MARTGITATTIPAITSEGYNLTDSADFTTMSTGSGNGVSFAYSARTLIILKNSTAGAADYTFVLANTSTITAVGGSVTDPVVDVAVGKTHLVKPAEVFKQSDGDMYIDCDVAGEILVVETT